MSDEALKLARECLERGTVGMLAGVDTLARAVIAQAEELERLRAALIEALDGWADTDDWENARIAELRRLVK